MNVFEEFRRVVLELEKRRVPYALVGAVALAFYTAPRFTQDIDLLMDSEDFAKAKDILESEGYFESAEPWTIGNVAIERHRFLKVAGPEDDMIIDILLAKDDVVRRILRNALAAESDEGQVMVASREDLIWLKRARGSKQDQADIERLEDEKDR